MGIRYNIVRVYPLFCRTKSKTTEIFELRQISTYERLALGMLRINVLDTNRSAIKS